MCVLNIISFADGFINQAGFYYYEQNGEYVKNEFVNTMEGTFYMGSDGIMVKNHWIEMNNGLYYAKNDGKIAKNEIVKIDNKSYYFSYEGLLLKGWIDDLYFANDQGYLVSGFQQLPIPNSWLTEDSKETEGWLYFDNSFKKVFADGIAYRTRLIGEDTYCFDANGIMRTGWRMIKETDPPMKGYMYFSETESTKFKYGTAVKNTWLDQETPAEIHTNSDIRYFYFGANGYLHCVNKGKFMKYRINEKTYLLNEYGYAVYGLREVDNEFYFFGDSINDCSMKTGKLKLDDGSGNNLEYYFNEKGIGYTGVYKNKLYYKGLLQKADRHSKYVAFNVNSKPILVNQNGIVLKNKKKIKDGNGVEWSTNESGMVTYTDEGSIEEPEKPYETED